MGMFDGLAGAAISGIGGFLTNQSQQQLAQQAQQFSAAQSDKQMQFQQEMRSTQYQTAVDDLKKAGLNPMLAYTQGGAGTPVGSAAVGQQAQLKNPVEGFSHSAAAGANIKADLELKDANTTEAVSRTNVNEQQARKTDAETAAIVLGMPNISQDFKLKVANTLLSNAQAGVASASEAKTRQDILISQPEAKMSQTPYGQTRPYLKDALQGVTSATSAFGKIK
jgi:hypothetical protein